MCVKHIKRKPQSDRSRFVLSGKKPNDVTYSICGASSLKKYSIDITVLSLKCEQSVCGLQACLAWHRHFSCILSLLCLLSLPNRGFSGFPCHSSQGLLRKLEANSKKFAVYIHTSPLSFCWFGVISQAYPISPVLFRPLKVSPGLQIAEHLSPYLRVANATLSWESRQLGSDLRSATIWS